MTNDPRLQNITVPGELIVQSDSQEQVKTRSKSVTSKCTYISAFAMTQSQFFVNKDDKQKCV